MIPMTAILIADRALIAEACLFRASIEEWYLHADCVVYGFKIFHK